MGRPRLAWLLTLPIVAVGGLTAHAVAYSVVVAPTHHAGHPLSAHGSVASLRVCAAMCLALLALGAVGYAAQGFRKGATPRVPLWLFGLLPPSGFVLQEQFEHIVGTQALAPVPALEPAFLVGLALQIPFAFAAYLVARALLRVVVCLARSLASEAPRLLPLLLPQPVPRADDSLRLAPLAFGRGARAPPLLLPAE